MIAYNFQAAFAPQIATGTPDPKTLTLRRPRKPPSRHANVGEPIGLWTGLRSKEAQRRGVGLVILRGLLRFSERGIVSVVDLRAWDGGAAASSEALQRDLLAANSDPFARRDGFENWAALWGWHSTARDKEERGATSLLRHLVAWLPLKPDQIAAIDAGDARIEEVA